MTYLELVEHARDIGGLSDLCTLFGVPCTPSQRYKDGVLIAGVWVISYVDGRPFRPATDKYIWNCDYSRRGMAIEISPEELQGIL